MLYKKILIATDGSEHTEKAIIHAIELAKLTGAQLHAVYVISLVSPPDTLDIKPDTLRNRQMAWKSGNGSWKDSRQRRY